MSGGYTWWGIALAVLGWFGIASGSYGFMNWLTRDRVKRDQNNSEKD